MVGVKDDDLGEVPVAVIVVDMEFKNQVLTDLENVFQRNLAKFNVPREIRLLDDSSQEIDIEDIEEKVLKNEKGSN